MFSHTEISQVYYRAREGLHLGYLYQLVVCHPTGGSGWRDSKRLFPGDYADTLI